MRVGGAAALSLLSTAPLVAQPVPTFRTSVEAVYVDVFVTRDGQPVTGLTAADFEVRDDGVKQNVTLASFEATPVVGVMVFDTSASLAGAQLDDLKAAGRALLSGLRGQDQAALVTFSEKLSVTVPLGPDRSAVASALDGLVADGHSGVWDGLYTGLKLPVTHGRPMVVLFTDGRDNSSWLSRDQVFKVAEESEAILYVVAIVPPADELQTSAALLAVEPPHLRALRQVAEATGGRFFPASSSAQLERTFLHILADMNTRYLLSYRPIGVTREGWHRLEVKVKGRRGAVRNRSGYFVQAGGSGDLRQPLR